MAAWDPSTNFVNLDVTTGDGRVSAATRVRSNSAFVRELWEDEIIASYKANLVMPQLTVVMNHNRKKGDTFHVPNPVRGDASQKSTQAAITLIANQEGKKQYVIDQHWEYSRLIEDVVDIQADDSVRRFYTDDAGYALAKRADTEIHQVAAFLNAAGIGTETDPTVEATAAYDGAVTGILTAGALTQWDPTANANAGNSDPLAEDAIRKFIQTLDDNDSPVANRYLVLPPVEKNNLLGIQRFTEQAFVGEVGMGNSIRNGRVGDVYGVEVFVSTNCERVDDGAASDDQRAVLLFQEEALLMIEQLRPRAQTQYKQEYLSDLFTSDILFGTGVLRPEGGLAIIVDA
jgi:hypothetical protein